jgi:putative tricarboxylic transport membrane protein
MIKIATSLLFLSASVAYYIYGFRYSFYTSDGRFGAGFFPRVIGVSLVLLTLSNLVFEVRKRQPDAHNPNWRDIGVIAAMLVAFLVSLAVIGTVPSIFLFVLAVLAYLNAGRWAFNVAVAVGLATFIHVVFRVWLNASLPTGRFGIPWLS